MSMPTMNLAVGLVRRWVGLYTVGLPAEARDARRAEIESDLWEQEEDASLNDSRSYVIAFHVFGRWLMGVPADVSWRLEQVLAARRRERERELGNESRGQMAFMRIATLMAAFTVLVGALVSLGMGERHVSGHDVPRFVWGIAGLSAGTIILAGLSVMRRSPMLGGILVVAGAFPLAAILVWTILLPLLWVLLAMFVFIRALSFVWKRNALS